MKSKKIYRILITFIVALLCCSFFVIASADEGEVEKFTIRITAVNKITSKVIPVSGARYQIISSDGEVLDTVKTNSTGSATASIVLEEGRYYVKCIDAPKGYALNTEKHTVSVDARDVKKIEGKKTIVWKINESPIYAHFTLTDAKTGKTISEKGCILTIYKDGDLFDTITTNSSGVAKSTKPIPYGNYVLKATKAPTGYYLNRDAVKFTVGESSLNDEHEFTMKVMEEKLVGKIEARFNTTGVNLNGTRISGLAKGTFVYEIYDSKGDLFDKVTVKNGRGTFKETPYYGKFTIKCKSVPEGYYLDSTVQSFEITEHNVKEVNGEHVFTFAFDNKPITPNVRIDTTVPVLSGTTEEVENGFAVTKPVYERSLAVGAKYILMAKTGITLNNCDVNEAGDTVSELTITDNVKENQMKGIVLGEYALAEKSVPFGVTSQPGTVDVILGSETQNKQHPEVRVAYRYNFKETKIIFDAMGEEVIAEDPAGELTGTVVRNEGKPGYIYGLYTDQDFEIVSNDKEKKVLPADTMIATAVSDDWGHVTFNLDCPFGKYYIRELGSQVGFPVNEDWIVRFDTTEGTVQENNVIVKLDNTQHSCVLVSQTFTSVDTDGNPVAGAKIEIRNKNDEVVCRVLTNEEGKVTVALAVNDYIALECGAPNGYDKSTEVKDFMLRQDTQPENISFASEVVKVIVNVLDENGKPKEGATYELYDASNNLVASASSDNNGQLVFTGLKQGVYTAKMSNSLSGYRKDRKGFEINVTDAHVNETAEQQTVNMVRDALHGGKLTGVEIGSISGAGAIALGGAAFGILKKKKKND